MDVQWGFDVTPAIRKLEQVERKAVDLTPFWTDVFAPAFFSDIQDNFDMEGAMVGGWSPLSPGYAAWKARHHGAHLGILELSGRLRGSLRWTTGGIGPEGIFDARPTSLTIGTSVPHASYHQDGDGVPKREFLFLRDDDPEFYGQLWYDWFESRE